MDNGGIKRKDSQLEKLSGLNSNALHMYTSFSGSSSLCGGLRALSFQKRFDLEASGTSQRVRGVELTNIEIISIG